jgi:hypothetical protein
MFFEEYINFKIFRYVMRRGFIPVKSFRSHLHPQPSGLGLNIKDRVQNLLKMLSECYVQTKGFEIYNFQAIQVRASRLK